jgi:hypothetical protein
LQTILFEKFKLSQGHGEDFRDSPYLVLNNISDARWMLLHSPQFRQHLFSAPFFPLVISKWATSPFIFAFDCQNLFNLNQSTRRQPMAQLYTKNDIHHQTPFHWETQQTFNLSTSFTTFFCSHTKLLLATRNRFYFQNS